ncbi:MAG: putative peptide maturation dehydrogenase [Mizugakiibacter sp.]|uniref:putative peptide maturation dehydrogenase n=1 Tax=Mizugakiibacter sp. TaxID=1972610 RepID=UPI0031C9B06D|nr:putative peptide maturation dehydrogenase [Xanthomonadaceae bacterium]
MRIRRCAFLFVELRERKVFDLERLLKGETGLANIREWFALAPHLENEVRLSIEELKILEGFSPTDWTSHLGSMPADELNTVNQLIEKGILIMEGSGEASRMDAVVRDTHWCGLPAVMHRFTRWHGVNTNEEERRFDEETDQRFLERLGSAPSVVQERTSTDSRQKLPRPAPTSLDRLLSSRATCRNFDNLHALSYEDFASTLYRVFGARAAAEIAPGMPILKRSCPSAGGLHPTEAYLLVQNVNGVGPGLYHYHPIDHALEPLRALDRQVAREHVERLIAGQQHFFDVHVLVVLASRFHRTFWKYRNHAKAYRAVILDAGHLSQTLYLTATELGLGVFVTAAVNEVDIEHAFGLDPLQEGPLAVCGFGVRAEARQELEFGPLGALWPDAKR